MGPHAIVENFTRKDPSTEVRDTATLPDCDCYGSLVSVGSRLGLLWGVDCFCGLGIGAVPVSSEGSGFTEPFPVPTAWQSCRARSFACRSMSIERWTRNQQQVLICKRTSPYASAPVPLNRRHMRVLVVVSLFHCGLNCCRRPCSALVVLASWLPGYSCYSFGSQLIARHSQGHDV